MSAVQELTYAAAAALALQQAMEADPRIVALGEDLGRGGVFGQYRGLPQQFGPERIIDTPISEANIMGAAVGMALAGLRPVVEMRVIDFALCAMDEIVNQAAKNRYMFGGQGRVPLVARMPIGIWSASAAQHSQSLEAWFAHLPGLVVAVPATPQDNFSLLKASLASGDPVIYMEHKELWGQTGPVDTTLDLPLGRANAIREGSDLTIVTWSRGVAPTLQALTHEALQGASVEVIDLRTLRPMDTDTIIRSIMKTGRCVTIDEGYRQCGMGAEIAARIMEGAFDYLDAPVMRVTGKDVPMPYAANLEKLALPSVAEVVEAAKATLYR